MPSKTATLIFEGDAGNLQETAKKINERLAQLQERFEGLKETALGIFIIDKLPELYEKLSEGIKEVLEVGAHFHDLAANTGSAVSELVVLEEEFKAAGKSAEDIPGALAHMQKVLTEGTENTLLTDLGVDLDELRKKTPIEQFHLLGKAINDLKNPNDRATAAMALFSKEGHSLLSLFHEEGFGEAGERVGEQAAILNEDAALFSAASTKLGTAGLKTQGFFVGIADRVVPVLMPLLDRFEKFDAARAGQGVGDMINAFASNSTPMQTVVTSLMISSAEVINFIVDGLTSAAVSFGMEMKGIALAFISEIERGLGNAILGLSGKPGMSWAAPVGGALIGDSMSNSAESKRDADRMASWTHVGLMDSAIESMSKNLAGQMDEALGNASNMHASALAKHPELAEQMGAPELQLFQPNVSHLASIGGAYGSFAGTDPLLEANSIAREHTELLRGIRENTARSGASGAPRRPAQHPE